MGMGAGQLSYEEDQRFFFEQLYKIIESESVDVIICAGDIYDSSVSNADAISLYNEVVNKICKELGKKFIVIAGNHDGAERISTYAQLLEGAGLYVKGRIEKEIKPVSIGNVDIYPIPFFNKDEVIAFNSDKRDDIRTPEQAMMVVCDGIRDKMDKSRINIVVAHAYIVGAALSDSDRSAKVGQASATSKDVFKGFDYVALGHIHRPQEINERLVYSGSPVKYSFGSEEKQQKRVVVIDTEDMLKKTIELNELHGRKTVRGTYDSIIGRSDFQNDYLCLEVTDRYATLELICELREKFPYLLEVNGKDYEIIAQSSSLSLEEIERLDDMQIMKKFFEDTFSKSPSDFQIELFEKALEDARKEELQ